MMQPQNRMEKRGRKRRVVEGMPQEGTPVEMVPVVREVMKCPRCGSARHGQWEMIRVAPSGTYYWCRGCGSKIVQSNGQLFVIG